ncbi:MAG: alpha/beta hydrolase [Dysgonamonadaceae bacterium]|jgi:acetyl esterase/lipase|nr:alpha/beta hydrolase [Dysgonamonadaceae bacterium]
MKIFFLAILLLTSMTISAQELMEIPVWPGGTTESNGITAEETTNGSGHVSNVSVASFKIYPADKAKNTGIAVLICPGGGYGIEAAGHEGVDFAQWYAENGITGIVMKYRLPNGHHKIPLKDVQEAMRIIRHRASEWNINPHKIGVSGFSAGGHLASTLLTHFDESSKPDFGILFYPVITFGEINTHMGSRKNLLGADEKNQELIDYYSNEKQIRDNTPPTLLLLSDDDKGVVPENSILFYRGLKEKNIPACLYIFPVGGHGWGFKKDFRYHEQMKELVLEWLFASCR